jgi:HK97 gp10 family phage protein
MTIVAKVTGFRELEEALAELPKTVAKNVLRRTAVEALTPVMETAKAKAPRRSGQLHDSIAIRTARNETFNRRASAAFKKYGSAKGVRRDPSTGISLSTGPTGRFRKNRKGGRPTGLWAYARYQEFGTAEMQANPYMRPAWDAEKDAMLDRVRTSLTLQLQKAKERMRRKALRAAAKA